MGEPVLLFATQINPFQIKLKWKKKHILVKFTDKSQDLLCSLEIHRCQEISQGESKLKFLLEIISFDPLFFSWVIFMLNTIFRNSKD